MVQTVYRSNHLGDVAPASLIPSSGSTTVAMSNNGDSSRYTCHDFRQEMILNGLRNRYHSDDISEEERRQLAAEIRKLEAAIGIN